MALVTSITLYVEVDGGLSSKSLALLSDSVHVGIDLISIFLAIGIEYYVFFGGDQSRTKMIRGCGGVVSSIFLFLSVGLVFQEAVDRLFVRDPINSVRMIVFAAIGLVGNWISHSVLDSSHEEHDTHVALIAHVDSDLYQSIGVVLAGLAILVTRLEILDPISSFAIVIILTRLSVKTLRRSWRSARSARTE